MSVKNVYVSQGAPEYDAIVVGSGISGGFAAKELCEKGLKTIVLERGRDVVHGEDYITEHKPKWEFEFRGRGDRKLLEEEYPVQSRSSPVNESNLHWFVKDTEHPYIEVNPFTWVRGYHVGGRSIMWGRHCYRLSDLDLEANLREGVAVDWPIRYGDLQPWYDYVDDWVGINGEALGLAHLPDSQFLPPFPLNSGEQVLREAVRKSFPERYVTIGRTAILTQPHRGRAACHYCGPCSRGCSAGAYFSSQSSTLPAARATGNMTLRPNSVVHSIIYDPESGRAAGVRVVDAVTMEQLEFRAKVIFLCASTLGSTQILLNSTSTAFPDGLANSSGTLGHYLMDHHFEVGASGDLPGLEDVYYRGNRPTGIYIPRFRNLGDRATRRSDFLRGYGYQGDARREGWGRPTTGFGVALKEQLRDPGQWRVSINAFGEMLPREDNVVELDSERTDKWGIPLLRIDCTFGENEMAMRKDMMQSAVDMLEVAGCSNIATFDRNDIAPGLGIHEMGTARMGRDPKTSVLNEWNQAHDVPNLFVTDGSCMTSAGCQNPSYTYMALTARAADYAVRELKRLNI
ncbi:MAG: GMC family oxidoreductase [Rhodothermia bacterium]|nr:GMC family oxidoreductase [Rhodothermia bacterium]